MLHISAGAASTMLNIFIGFRQKKEISEWKARKFSFLGIKVIKENGICRTKHVRRSISIWRTFLNIFHRNKNRFQSMDSIVPDQKEFPALVLPWANVGDIKWKKNEILKKSEIWADLLTFKTSNLKSILTVCCQVHVICEWNIFHHNEHVAHSKPWREVGS